MKNYIKSVSLLLLFDSASAHFFRNLDDDSDSGEQKHVEEKLEPVYLPYTPLTLKDGTVVYPNEMNHVDEFSTPDGCQEWTNGCTTCEIDEFGIPNNCVKKPGCDYTSCLPHCSEFQQPEFANVPPQNCLQWFDGCNTCHFDPDKLYFVSSYNGEQIVREERNENNLVCTTEECKEDQMKEPKCKIRMSCEVTKEHAEEAM